MNNFKISLGNKILQEINKMHPIDYNKPEDEAGDKRSQGSCKMSKSRKIKKHTQKPQKPEKQRTPKITNFFKKIQTGIHIQRPFTSSQKKELKRSPEEEQQIEELLNEQRELQHEEQMLKKEIETLKSQEQMMQQESTIYFKRLRQCELVDLKQRYEIIRMQKGLPDFRRVEVNYGQTKTTLQIKQILLKITQKSSILQNQQISSIQRSYLQQQLQNLQSQLRILSSQNQAYHQRLQISQKQKTCKFAQMNWPLINKRYQILELIGSGGYSEVYKALNITNNEFIAVKLCSVAEMAQVSSEVYLKHLFRECETHQQLRHSNIVKLFEVIELDPSTFCLALQYCQGPQLSKYLKNKERLEQNQAKSIMFQIFETLYYLNNFSSKKIVHYDLKPQNIMFHQGLIKILDFGLNKQIDEQESRAALTSAGMGTHAYLPPEIHSYDPDDDRVLTSKVDIWSAGIIFYQLLNGKRPTSVEDMKNYANKLQKIHKGTIDIIELCLKLNPNERITPQEVYFHPYFDDFQRQYKRKTFYVFQYC